MERSQNERNMTFLSTSVSTHTAARAEAFLRVMSQMDIKQSQHISPQVLQRDKAKPPSIIY